MVWLMTLDTVHSRNCILSCHCRYCILSSFSVTLILLLRVVLNFIGVRIIGGLQSLFSLLQAIKPLLPFNQKRTFTVLLLVSEVIFNLTGWATARGIYNTLLVSSRQVNPAVSINLHIRMRLRLLIPS